MQYIGNAIDLAYQLRSDLDRLAAGMTLLSQSLERLHEVVRVDTRCCGGVCDLLTISMGLPTTNSNSLASTMSSSRSTSRVKSRGGYNVLDLDSDNDNDGGSVFGNSSHGRGSSVMSSSSHSSAF